MISVRFAPAPFNLRPFVAGAVEKLGYFRADSVDHLTEIIERLWPTGVSSTMLIYNDILHDLTEEEKQAAGLEKGRTNREIWSLLSDAGRTDPRGAAVTLTLWIISSVQRARFDHEEPSWSKFCDRVRLVAHASPEYHCDRSRELDGLVVHREERFPLPLSGCDRDWCPCRWDYLPNGP